MFYRHCGKQKLQLKHPLCGLIAYHPCIFIEISSTHPVFIQPGNDPGLPPRRERMGIPQRPRAAPSRGRPAGPDRGRADAPEAPRRRQHPSPGVVLLASRREARHLLCRPRPGHIRIGKTQLCVSLGLS